MGRLPQAASCDLGEPLPEGFPKPVANQGLGIRPWVCPRQAWAENDATRRALFGAPGSIAGAFYTTRNDAAFAGERHGVDDLYHEPVHLQRRREGGKGLAGGSHGLANPPGNVQASGEIAKRIVPIMIEPTSVNQEARTDFQYSDIRAYVRQQRRTVLECLLGLVENWLAAGPVFLIGAACTAGGRPWLAPVGPWRALRKFFTKKGCRMVDTLAGVSAR